MTSGRQPGSAHHAGTTLSYDGGWGDYRPAIDRHARTVGRDAPAPSIDGRLNPAFVEWMMMLPAGWVTGIDISRTAQLRCLGNSLVWLQAATAWAALLGVDTREREKDGSDVADTASIRQQRTGNPRQRRTGPSDSDPMPLIPPPQPGSGDGWHNPNRSNELLNEEPNQ